MTPEIGTFRVRALFESEGSVKIGSETLTLDTLRIPEYQRPYKWETSHVHALLKDTQRSAPDAPYRLGTIVLHKTTGNEGADCHFDIVDGQQRLVTLGLLLGKDTSITRPETHHKSPAYKIVSALSKPKRTEEILDCELVCIILHDLDEAFQFFDSQNSRGKPLAAHNLLKAHHLSGGTWPDESQKAEWAEQWDEWDAPGRNNAEIIPLGRLFDDHIYPTLKWMRRESAGDAFTQAELYLLKGMESLPEHDARRPGPPLASTALARPIPGTLGVPILRGAPFFSAVASYQLLFKNAANFSAQADSPKKKIAAELQTTGAGSHYVFLLLTNAIAFYMDRFPEAKTQKEDVDFIFRWACEARLEHTTFWATVDKWATTHKENLNIFHMIAWKYDDSSPLFPAMRQLASSVNLKPQEKNTRLDELKNIIRELLIRTN